MCVRVQEAVEKSRAYLFSSISILSVSGLVKATSESMLK